MSDFPDLVILGSGAVSALGQDMFQTGLCRRAGLNRFFQSTFVDTAGEPISLSFLTTLPADLSGLERLLRLAVPATHECLSGMPDPIPFSRVGLVLCVAERFGARDAKGTPDAYGMEIGRRLIEQVEARIPIPQWRVLPLGHAAGAWAVDVARDWIVEQQVDAVIVVGAHTYYDWDALQVLERQDRIVTADNLDGMVPGEAGAALLIASADRARLAGMPPQCAIRGSGTANEPAPILSDLVCLADGYTAALRSAIVPLRQRQQRSNLWYVDLSHEGYKTKEFQSVIARFGDVIGIETDLQTPGRDLGDTGAASLPLFMALAAEAWRRGYGSDSTAVCLAGSDGGERGAILLEELS